MKASKLFHKFNLKDRVSNTKIKEIETRYETFAEIPLISGGFIANTRNKTEIDTVHIIKSHKNIRQKQNRTYLESYTLYDNEYKRIPWIWNINTTSIHPSPSRNKTAIINKISIQDKDAKNKKKSVIEIYDNHKLIDTIYPPSSSFGDIHKKDPFHSVSWNKQENLIAFIAEKDDIKSNNFFAKKTLIKWNKEEEDKEDATAIGSMYEFKENFGEQVDGATQTTLFIYDLNKKQLFSFDEIINNGNIVMSECLFDPNDSTSIITVSYNVFPRKLGLRFYNSRPSTLSLIKIPENIENTDEIRMINLAPHDFSPQYPRFSPNGKSLVYLSTNNTFSHITASRLRCIEWPIMNEEKIDIDTIIDIPTNVTSKNVLQNDEFGGIFCYGGVPIRCWIDDETLIINSVYGHIWGSLLINIKDKTVVKLDELKDILDTFNDIENEICRDFTVLDVDNDCGNILFVVSSIQRGHSAFLYNIERNKVYSLTKCITDNDNDALIQSISNIKTRVISNQCMDNNDEIYESILYLPPKGMTQYDDDPILLLYVHGGPHSANTLCFSYYTLCLLYSGFAIVQVNYRGSIGVCSEFVECLHGNIGRMDVDDCMNAFNFVCDNADSLLDIDTKDKMSKLKKIVMGGSHGGFLTGHFIAQFPDVFMCASSGNPVLNLVSMFGLSDIPDWILCECGINTIYDEKCLMKPLSTKEMEIINSKSPHFYIENVQTPFQILCGTKDLRVPMQQSIDYYKMLRARNGDEKARLLIYPDCQHSLNDTIDQEYDALCNTCAWFYYHTRCIGDTDSDSNKSAITAKIDSLLSILDA